jgi:hypothetical protein
MHCVVTKIDETKPYLSTLKSFSNLGSFIFIFSNNNIEIPTEIDSKYFKFITDQSSLHNCKLKMMNFVCEEFGLTNAIWMDNDISSKKYIPYQWGGTDDDFEIQNKFNYFPRNKNDVFNFKLTQRLFELVGIHGSLFFIDDELFENEKEVNIDPFMFGVNSTMLNNFTDFLSNLQDSSTNEFNLLDSQFDVAKIKFTTKLNLLNERIFHEDPLRVGSTDISE